MAKEVKPDPRPKRVRFQFLLDDAKKEVQPIVKQFDRWVARREMTRWIVDMYRLWAELVDGKTEKLVEMFPDMAIRLTSRDGDKLLQSIYDQQAIIIKKLESGATIQSPSIGGLKPLAGANFKVAPPNFEDENAVLNVRKDTNAGANTTASFLDAAFGMVSASKRAD